MNLWRIGKHSISIIFDTLLNWNTIIHFIIKSIINNLMSSKNIVIIQWLMGVYINLIVLSLFLSFFFVTTSFPKEKLFIWKYFFKLFFIFFLVINSLFFKNHLYFSKFITLLILDGISFFKSIFLLYQNRYYKKFFS